MKLLVKYFLRGCLVIAPIAVTAWVLVWVVSTVAAFMPAGFPVLGLFASVGFVVGIGFLASGVAGQAVVSALEAWIGRVPLVKVLYNSIRDLLGAFVGERKSFDKPVMVSVVPGSSVKALGFMTREGLAFAADHVAVYFPQSYNFAGNVVVCRREIVEPIDVPPADLMAFIVSGGVSATRRDAESAPGA